MATTFLDSLKNAPFLQSIKDKKSGKCRTCGNLVRINDNLIGCTVKDKILLPDYLPYDGTHKCPDWVESEVE